MDFCGFGTRGGVGGNGAPFECDWEEEEEEEEGRRDEKSNVTRKGSFGSCILWTFFLFCYFLGLGFWGRDDISALGNKMLHCPFV